MTIQPAKKQRIVYIDIAKGVLMLMLVFRHMSMLGGDLSDVGAPFFSQINDSSVFFACFRMQCFFVITGYCSNFDKPFKQFLWQNFRGLILVGLAYEAILALLSCFSRDVGFMATLHELVFSFFTHGNCYWFLGALFLSKFLYYTLHKLKLKNHHIFLVSLVLMCLAIYIFTAHHNFVASDDYHFKHNVDLWYVFHAMYLVPFLSVGRAFRQHNWFESRWCMPVGIMFAVVMLPLSFLGIEFPTLTYYIGLTSYYEIPIHFLLAISGTCFTIQISKWIAKSNFFTTFGRESLLIYALHAKMLLLTEKVLFRYALAPSSWLNVIVLIFTTVAIVVLMLLIAIKVKEWLKEKTSKILQNAKGLISIN